MDTKDRKIFWNVLCSLDGENPDLDANKLADSIKYPKFLYRYRPISVSSVDSLQNNFLFFSSADHYDDPFDTLIKLDYKKIKSVADNAKAAMNTGNIFEFCKAAEFSNEQTSSFVSEFEKYDADRIENEIDDYLKRNIQFLLQKSIRSVCFSEIGNNETMWLKYADQYKGFCLIYDVCDEDTILCGKEAKCEKCPSNFSCSLYPVYYSDEGYDATRYAMALAAYNALDKVANDSVKRTFMKVFPNMNWQSERVALIKSKCHEYDREWRLLFNTNVTGKVMQKWRPYGVIIGLRTNESDTDLIVRSAKAAGIKHIFKSFISNKNRLEYKEIISFE